MEWANWRFFVTPRQPFTHHRHIIDNGPCSIADLAIMETPLRSKENVLTGFPHCVGTKDYFIT